MPDVPDPSVRRLDPARYGPMRAVLRGGGGRGRPALASATLRFGDRTHRLLLAPGDLARIRALVRRGRTAGILPAPTEPP
jgi:hypothetical protein